MSSLSPLQMQLLNYPKIVPQELGRLPSGLPERFAQWDITECHVDATMKMRIGILDPRSTSGLSMQNVTSYLTLPGQALLSRAALLSYRDSILAWIVQERLCNPEFAKWWRHILIPTHVGLIPLVDLVSYLPSAE